MELFFILCGLAVGGFLMFDRAPEKTKSYGEDVALEMLERIRNRRTVRHFNPKLEVDDRSLKRILEAGTWAPYAPYEAQPWRFIAVRGEERERTVEYISQAKTIRKYMEAVFEEEQMPTDDDELRRQVWAEWNKFIAGFVRNLGEAPVTIVGLVRKSEFKSVERYHTESTWAAAQNQMLQAEAEGLNTGIVTFHEPKIEAELLTYLGYNPKGWSLVYLLNVGFAKKIKRPADRLDALYEIRG